MNRRRYDGYRALQDAMARQALDENPAAIIGELAEDLRLAGWAIEAGEAVARVPRGLLMLVERGDLSQAAADRLWDLLRRCGPGGSWPAWEQQPAASRQGAVQRR